MAKGHTFRKSTQSSVHTVMATLSIWKVKVDCDKLQKLHILPLIFYLSPVAHKVDGYQPWPCIRITGDTLDLYSLGSGWASTVFKNSPSDSNCT